MVKLRELPPSVLHEIRSFVRQQRGKMPVSGGGPTPGGGYVKSMVEAVKEKWGVELSPGQIYALQRPRPRKVELPGEVAGWLEEEFGSAQEGLRRLMELARQMAGRPPPKLRAAVARLGGRLLSYEEAVRELKEAGCEDPHEALRELGRLGYLANEGGKLRFYRYRRPPELSVIKFLTG